MSEEIVKLKVCECGSADFYYDLHKPEIVCKKCGLIEEPTLPL